MYVTTKRMTLAEAHPPLSHTKHTLSVLFFPVRLTLSLSITHNGLAPTHSFSRVTAGDDADSSTVSRDPAPTQGSKERGLPRLLYSLILNVILVAAAGVYV